MIFIYFSEIFTCPSVASKLEINLSRSKIHSSLTSRRVLRYSLHSDITFYLTGEAGSWGGEGGSGPLPTLLGLGLGVAGWSEGPLTTWPGGGGGGEGAGLSSLDMFKTGAITMTHSAVQYARGLCCNLSFRHCLHVVYFRPFLSVAPLIF